MTTLVHFIRVGVLAVAMGCSGCELIIEKYHPKDADMIENFNAHREDFETLVQMLKEDRALGRVANDFTRTSNFFGDCKEETMECSTAKEIGVTEARLSEYRRLFNKLDLEKGIEGYGKKETIAFLASTKGLSVTGSTKGYWHTTVAPKTIVDDLDTYWSADGKSFLATRHIDGNWYLFFDYED